MIFDFEESEVQDREKTKKRRRIAVHPLFKKTKLEGEYWTRYKELIGHEEKNFKYFRMNRYQFGILLNKKNPLITKHTISLSFPLSIIHRYPGSHSQTRTDTNRADKTLFLRILARHGPCLTASVRSYYDRYEYVHTHCMGE